MVSGTYSPNDSYAVKNHVALVGGFTAMSSGSYDRSRETRPDGDGNKGIVSNDNAYKGGGMYDATYSPLTLMNIFLSENTASKRGGGIFQNGDGESLTLINTIL